MDKRCRADMLEQVDAEMEAKNKERKGRPLHWAGWVGRLRLDGGWYAGEDPALLSLSLLELLDGYPRIFVLLDLRVLGWLGFSAMMLV